MTKQEEKEYRRVHRQFIALSIAVAEQSTKEVIEARARAILIDSSKVASIEESATRKLEFLALTDEA